MKIKTTLNFSNNKIKPVFKDARGSIFDLLEEKVGHIGMVTFVPGAERGNHYHKKSTQYSFVIEGKLKLTISDLTGKNKKTYNLEEGTFTVIPPKLIHTYKALTSAKMLDITTLNRKGNGYENDTVKIK